LPIFAGAKEEAMAMNANDDGADDEAIYLRRLTDGSCCVLDASDALIALAEDCFERRKQVDLVAPAKNVATTDDTLVAGE
jgi:hypothetical protein